MARIAARNARIYVSTSNAGTPIPLPFIAAVSVDSSTDQIDVTAFGDTNKVKVTGLPNFEGTLSGFYDSASTATDDALWLASRDGLARNFYLYPTTGDTTKYFYGEAFFDFSLTTEVAGAVAVSGKFVAAGSITRKG